MKSVARPPATLLDLLDRVLDRGLVINADVIISLAGVPLIGINLRAALAGMETMVEYGVMREWDQSIRAQRGRSAEAFGAAMALAGRTPIAAHTGPRERGGEDGKSDERHRN